MSGTSGQVRQLYAGSKALRTAAGALDNQLATALTIARARFGETVAPDVVFRVLDLLREDEDHWQQVLGEKSGG